MQLRLGLALAGVVLALSAAGCGNLISGAASRAHHAPASAHEEFVRFTHRAPLVPAGFKSVNIFSTQLDVPASWSPSDQTSRSVTLGGPSGSASVTELTASLTKGGLWLPLNTSSRAHPFLLDTGSASSGSISETVLTQAGQLIVLSVHVPPADSKTAAAILRTWRHPAPATSTEAVHRLAGDDAGTASYAGEQGWFLASGNAAASQESFYLFHSSDHGKQWSLQNASHWSAGSPTFPRTAGNAAMDFVGPSTGFIAELSAMQPTLLVYRTGDGGKLWTQTSAHLPSSFWPGDAAPVIHFSSPADGQIFAPLSQAHLDAVYDTENGGNTWHFAQIENIASLASSHVLIQEALHTDAGKIALPLFGPAKIPHSPLAGLSATATVHGSLSQYSVSIWQTQQCYPVNSPEIAQDLIEPAPIASWHVTEVSAQAPTASLLQSGNLYWRQPAGHPHPVSLATGLPGLQYPSSTLVASQALSHGPVLLWHEGEWTLEVKGGSSRAEQAAATPLIRYLHTHFLPGYSGLFVVAITPTEGIQSRLDWAQGALLMEVADDVPSASNPLITARLAVSWQQYS